MTKRILLWVAGAGFTLFNANTLGQQVDGGALLRQQRPEELPAPPPPARLDIKPSALERKPAEETQEQSRLFVNGYRLLNESPILPKKALDELLRPLTGRSLTFAEIQQAADIVGSYFKSRGYVFANAYVPRQEIENGIVVLDVIVGTRASPKTPNGDIVLKLERTLRLDPEFARSMVASDLPPGEPVKLEQVERGLMLLNDLAGVKASGVVVPGEDPGTVALIVQAEEGALVNATASADNYGNNATGQARAGADFAINGLAGRGDALMLRLAKSLGTTQGTVSYAVALNASGLRFQVTGSAMDYRQRSSSLDLNGRSTLASVGLSYPLIFTRRNSLTANLLLNDKKIVDRSGELDISVRNNLNVSTALRGSALLENLGASAAYGLSLITGALDRGVAADLRQDAATRRTAGHYAIARLDGSYAYGVSPTLMLQANAEAQFASRNLDSSERFYAGGPQGVRAYPTDEPGGDAGGLLRFEARWHPWRLPANQDMSLLGFVDWARLRRNRKLWEGWNSSAPGMGNSFSLGGTGIGVNYARQGLGRVEFVYARKIGSRDRGGAPAAGLDTSEGRVWVSAVLFF